MPEAEYLIRPSSHEGWLVIPADTLAEVLTPHGSGAEPAAGFGDFHLRAPSYEISFSNEDPGWQVSFDGDISQLNPDELISQIAGQIQNATGISTEWLRYT